MLCPSAIALIITRLKRIATMGKTKLPWNLRMGIIWKIIFIKSTGRLKVKVGIILRKREICYVK